MRTDEPRDLQIGSFIDGEWQVRDGERLGVVSPSSEATIGFQHVASEDEVDLAVRAARHSFDVGDWSQLSVEQRVAVARDASAWLGPQTDRIASLMTAEMGVPITTSRAVVDRCRGLIDYVATVALTTTECEWRTDGVPATVLREPGGVVAAIAPWNGPFSMAVNKIAPALLAGCSVIFKPAPESPFDVELLIEAFRHAGLPPGVLNLVTGGVDTGRALVSHAEVDHVAFTGSTRAGREIGAVCGRSFKRMHLELGGKSAAIVAEDANPEKVVEGLRLGSFSNTGQVCASFSRILVPRGKTDDVVDLLRTSAATWRIGDPFDEQTTMGPLVSQEHWERVTAHVARAKQDGARVAFGGGRPDGLDVGCYFEPTVLVDVVNAMPIAQDEVFGPVACVMEYSDIDEAVAIANDSRYGLHGGVFTEDRQLAETVAKRIRAGTFTVNGFAYNNRAPFGGVKCSGIGRDTGREGYESFLELKTVNFPDLSPR